MRITEAEMLNKPKSLTERAFDMIRIARKANPAHRILPEVIKIRCPANLDLKNSTNGCVFIGRNSIDSIATVGCCQGGEQFHFLKDA
jgi:hypothetical protein